MGTLCCRPIQQNKSPDYDQTTPDNLQQIVGQDSQPRYKSINATRSFDQNDPDSRKTTWDNTRENRVNLSDLIHHRAQNQRRNALPLEEIRPDFLQIRQGEENIRNSLHNTLPYDGQNPPTFQPAHRSLLRTCRSGDTVLTFGRNLTELQSKLDIRADGEDLSYESQSPLTSPQALLNKSEVPSDAVLRRQRNQSVQSGGRVARNSKDEFKESAKSSHLSSEYFSAKERFSSEHNNH